MATKRNAYGRLPKRTRNRIGTPPAPTMTIFGHTYHVLPWNAPVRATPIADIRAMQERIRAAHAKE